MRSEKKLQEERAKILSKGADTRFERYLGYILIIIIIIIYILSYVLFFYLHYENITWVKGMLYEKQFKGMTFSEECIREGEIRSKYNLYTKTFFDRMYLYCAGVMDYLVREVCSKKELCLVPFDSEETMKTRLYRFIGSLKKMVTTVLTEYKVYFGIDPKDKHKSCPKCIGDYYNWDLEKRKVLENARVKMDVDNFVRMCETGDIKSITNALYNIDMTNMPKEQRKKIYSIYINKISEIVTGAMRYKGLPPGGFRNELGEEELKDLREIEDLMRKDLDQYRIIRYNGKDHVCKVVTEEELEILYSKLAGLDKKGRDALLNKYRGVHIDGTVKLCKVSRAFLEEESIVKSGKLSVTMIDFNDKEELFILCEDATKEELDLLENLEEDTCVVVGNKKYVVKKVMGKRLLYRSYNESR